MGLLGRWRGSGSEQKKTALALRARKSLFIALNVISPFHHTDQSMGRAESVAKAWNFLLRLQGATPAFVLAEDRTQYEPLAAAVARDLAALGSLATCAF